MKELISFQNVTICQNQKVLYKDLNFSINKGDRYIFLGPNGIGKSFLMELLFLGYTGELAERYKGISISGDIVDSQGNSYLNPRTNKAISYVSQAEDFYAGATVKSYCETSCHGIGLDLDETKLNNLLSKFGLLEKKNVKIRNNVSFGEAKLIHIISRILKLPNADLLMLDEPLNHLSFKNSQIFNEIITEEIHNKEDLSIIMISHCRAMNFTDKAMVYSTDRNNIEFRPYVSYDCFENEIQSECKC